MNEHIEILREIVVSEASWVLFEHGTCVFLIDCDGDLAGAATQLLREVGPVEIGGPQADFAVIELENEVGWGVTFDHPDLLTLVLPNEINVQPTELMIGLLGRAKTRRRRGEFENCACGRPANEFAAIKSRRPAPTNAVERNSEFVNAG